MVKTLREVHDEMANIIDAFPLVTIGQLKDLVNALATHVSTEEAKVSDYRSGLPIACVDFDGVIHSYKSGWKGTAVIPDDPMEGAIRWLEKMTEYFEVRIFSARCNDPAAIKNMITWFYKHGMSNDAMIKIKFEPGKPSAFVMIDDRAVQFNGTFIHPEQLRDFKPWYYDDPAYGRK